MTPKREVRTLRSECRAVTGADGVKHLVGHASTFNQSYDLGWFEETIASGAFDEDLSADPDVRCLFNHDPNFIMGRTKSKTLTLSADAIGLAYDCTPSSGPLSLQAIEAVNRGDVDGASFSFSVVKDKWEEQRDDKGAIVKTTRTIEKAKLYDVGPVVYPANPNATSSLRSMFPDGVPPEVRSRITKRNAMCACDCADCIAGDCEDCTNENCNDSNCTDCPMQSKAKALRKNIKRIDLSAQPSAGEKRAVEVLEAIRAESARESRFKASLQPDGTLELLVYEEIGYDWWTGEGLTAKSIKQQLDAAGPHTKIRVRINSPGGDAFEGIAIHNLLRAQAKPIECCVDGIAASAASVIAMCGDEIVMWPSAMMMVHNPWGICMGDAADMRKEAEVLEKISLSIGQAYVTKTGKTAAQIKDIMDSEAWMSAQDCLDGGFATSIAEQPDEEQEKEAIAMARSFRSLQRMKNVPKQFRNKTRRVDGEDLGPDCFLIVGDREDTKTWKLARKFSTKEKTKTRLIDALTRFNKLSGVSDEDKASAWTILVESCKEHGVELPEEAQDRGGLRSFLSPAQIYDFEKDLVARSADVRLRAIQASL